MVGRAVVMVFLGAAAVFGTACKGDGDGSGGGGSGGSTPIVLPSSNGQSCSTDSSCTDQAAVNAYSACIQGACAAEYKQCLGPDWESGTFGGDCKDLMECASQCTDCDQSCIDACTGKYLAGACQGCFTGPLASCAVGAITGGTCQIPCGPDLGGTSGACADLEACCNSLSAAEQTSCLSTYAQLKVGGDIACSAALSGYKSSGQCM